MGSDWITLTEVIDVAAEDAQQDQTAHLCGLILFDNLCEINAAQDKVYDLLSTRTTIICVIDREFPICVKIDHRL